jgi:transposase
VLGVDEWAYRKGRNYGTILVDLERRRVIDLLPDRSSESFAAWLYEHPGVEIITRDRSGTYAEGARCGAPNAMQVADRWHLIRNLTDAVERALVGRSALLKEAAASLAPHPKIEPVTPAPRPPTRAVRAKASRREARLERYEEVVRLHERGMSKSQIARTTGLSRGTIMRWLAAGGFPERMERPPVESILDPYRAYIDQRFAEGCHNAAKLLGEIRSRGYPGSRTPLRDYVQRLRRGVPKTTSPRAKRPSVRKCASWLILEESELAAEQREYLTALTALCPEVRTMRFLALEFRRMLKERDSSALGPWVEAARLSLLRRFAAGIHADVAAVRAAITLSWSNGPVEGHVNRLKMLKRQMYGRANFDLLRERVLHAA